MKKVLLLLSVLLLATAFVYAQTPSSQNPSSDQTSQSPSTQSSSPEQTSQSPSTQNPPSSQTPIDTTIQSDAI